jgi:hypothetical protein
VRLEGDALELRFAPAAGLLAHIADVVDAERQCCPFLTFRIEVEASGGPMTLHVTGPPGTRAVLETLVTLR